MRLRRLAACFASCGVSFVTAQPNPTPKAREPTEPLPPIFAPRPTNSEARSKAASRPRPTPPPTRRAISPEMAAKLSSVAARAAPPASPASTTSDNRPPTSEGNSDAVQLDPYVVQEDRLPEFKEREILTLKGKLKLARRRHPGAVGPLSDATALQLLEEDFARERRREAADLNGLLEIGGTKLPPELKRNIDAGALRPSGFSPELNAPFRPPK